MLLWHILLIEDARKQHCLLFQGMKFDMLGNVGEWCRDWHRNTYDGVVHAPGDGEIESDEQALRASRGGAYDTLLRNLRASARGTYAPDVRDRSIGVRPVRALDS